MKDTIIVNLFAGPGAGKTTGAWYISAKLKMAGADVEYISEFAKDKVWEENDLVFNEHELKAFAFDYIAAHDNSTGLTVEAEKAVIEYTKLIIEHFKGV